MGRSAYKLRTHYSTSECLERLSAAVDEERGRLGSWSGYAGSKPILGKFRGASFRLRKRPFDRIPSRRLFYGHFVSCEQGTLIHGTFKMRPFWKGCLIVLFSLLFVCLIAAICSPGRSVGDKPKMVAIFGGLIAWFAVLEIFQWLGRHDEKMVVELLENELRATQCDAG